MAARSPDLDLFAWVGASTLRADCHRNAELSRLGNIYQPPLRLVVAHLVNSRAKGGIAPLLLGLSFPPRSRSLARQAHMNPLHITEGKIPRSVTLYAPAILALLAGISPTSACSHTWPECFEAVLVTLVAFLFLWPFVQACYHGFRFATSLLRRPPSTPKA